MKRKTYTLLLACATLTVQAQTARSIKINITGDGQSEMTVYLPQEPTGRAIVACPGGGYSHLAMNHEGHDWAAFFNKQGIAYGVLKYRMPKGDRTLPISDAEQAMRTMRDSSAVWGINPYDVGIMGSSAGGHLASTISTHSAFDARPNFSILFYPVISMTQRESHKGSCVNFLGAEGEKNPQLIREFSNNYAVRSHLTPPAVILASNDDGVVPVVTNAVPYYTAMRKNGNHCSLYIYPSGGHGWGFRSNFKYHDQMLTDLSNWLASIPSPQKDAIRVACIGNSITHGSGIDMQEAKGYPAQLQQLLGNGYLVKNYGVGGRTMLNNGDHPYMKELAWSDAQAFKADIYVIKLGTNDSKDYNWSAHKAEFEDDMQQMIDALKPMVPVLNKKGKPTKKMKRAEKPAIYLCTPIKPFRDKWGITDSVMVSEVIPAIQRVAMRNGLPVIDMHHVITDAKMMTSDMIHPNDKGAAQMARTIYEAIKGKE